MAATAGNTLSVRPLEGTKYLVCKTVSLAVSLGSDMTNRGTLGYSMS